MLWSPEGWYTKGLQGVGRLGIWTQSAPGKKTILDGKFEFQCCGNSGLPTIGFEIGSFHFTYDSSKTSRLTNREV